MIDYWLPVMLFNFISYILYFKILILLFTVPYNVQRILSITVVVPFVSIHNTVALLIFIQYCTVYSISYNIIYNRMNYPYCTRKVSYTFMFTVHVTGTVRYMILYSKVWVIYLSQASWY